MPFVSRNRVPARRPPGRPRTAIPPDLRAILDHTFRTNTAWEEDVTATDGDDLREVVRLGALYAEHRRLSFRYRIREDDEGCKTMQMWLCPKRGYVRRKAS